MEYNGNNNNNILVQYAVSRKTRLIRCDIIIISYTDGNNIICVGTTNYYLFVFSIRIVLLTSNNTFPIIFFPRNRPRTPFSIVDTHTYTHTHIHT